MLETIDGNTILDYNFLFYIIISLATIIGFGFQGLRWIRQKMTENTTRAQKENEAAHSETRKRVDDLHDEVRETSRDLDDLSQSSSRSFIEVNQKLSEQKAELIKHDLVLDQLRSMLETLKDKFSK